MSASGNRKNETSSDEEPDYMSEDFLNQCTANDVRPSLLHNRTEKRKHDILKRQHEVNKTKTEKEREMKRSLEESLKVPIKEDNKGFQMLQKMGYKPGSSIGKDRNDPSRKGIVVPIDIELKRGRGGLGREQHELEKVEKTLGNPIEYRERRQKAVLEREVCLDLKKAQFACYGLDEESGKQKPTEFWYWPNLKVKAGKDKSIDSDDDDDESDLPSKKSRVADNEDEEEESSSSEEEDDDIPNATKLDIIADYLRSQYIYCLWCGTKYDNETDLKSSCPGIAKEDH